MREALLQFIQGIRRESSQPISFDSLLFQEKILDSMNILDLIGFIEKHLRRRLTNEEIVMSNFESAGKIAEVFFQDHA